MVIQLYQFDFSAPSRAVKMTAALLNVELENISVDISAGDHLQPEYTEMNPFQNIPTMKDEDIIIYDSHAIMQYLANKYAPDSPLYPNDPDQRALVDLMMHVNNSILSIRAEEILSCKFSGNEPSEEQVANANQSLAALETIMTARPFAAGEEFTLADVAISSTLSIYTITSFDLGEYPSVLEYMERVKEKCSPIYEEISEPAVELLKDLVSQKMGY